jgi:hypothetical protein
MTLEVKEPVLPPTETERGAIADLLKLNPQICENAARHAARVAPEAPASRPTAQEVTDAIDIACGRAPKSGIEQPVCKADAPPQAIESVRERVLKGHQFPSLPQGMELPDF